MHSSYLWLFLLLALALGSEVCKNPEEEVGLLGHVPRGGAKAGTYTAHPEGDSDLSACLRACCDSLRCNMAFLYQGNVCYSIQCRHESACDSLKVNGGKNSRSILVLVRERAGDPPKTSTPPPPFEAKPCQMGLGQCPKHEECRTFNVLEHIRLLLGQIPC